VGPVLTVLATATTGPIAIGAAALAAGLAGGAYSLSRGRVKGAAIEHARAVLAAEALADETRRNPTGGRKAP
jgi:hypothetical protein